MTEAQIQANIITYMRKVPGMVIFSVPNEASGNQAVRQMALIRTGLYPGVSDLIALYNGVPYFLEVKTPKGKQSPRQERFQAKVEAQGFTYAIVRSLGDVVDILNV